MVLVSSGIIIHRRQKKAHQNKMTKQEAINEFTHYHLPCVIAQYGKDDKPALREAWGIYTDQLCKDGKITMKQYETWSNPFNV